MKKNIVTIGGGSGQYILLSGLRDLAGINISAIVSMVDSGGSTGRLRDEYGVLPPGDILKCLLALSPDREAARKILLTKLCSNNRLNGHNAGNMLLTILAQYAGNFPDGVNALAQILGVRGRILPVTTDRATLVAELSDGSHLYGETTIDLPRGSQREKIKKTFLVPHHSQTIKVYAPVLNTIKQADYIIIGPGDLYTSIIPNFLVPGVAVELKKTKAKIIYIVNIMTKFGETDGFKVKDFVRVISGKISRQPDYILANNKKAGAGLIKKYKKQKAAFVNINKLNKKFADSLIRGDFLSVKGNIVRHDSEKLARAVGELIKIL